MVTKGKPKPICADKHMCYNAMNAIVKPAGTLCDLRDLPVK